MKDGDISLRRLMNDIIDYKLLEKWYQNKEVYSNFEQRVLTLEEIKNKYYPRTFENASIPVYIIEYKNNPVGIIQYKLINEEDRKLYNLHTGNVFEIDIFIGEISFHNKGIGKKSIEIISKYLFESKKADLLVMCPLKDNIKAIKCYEKCGYKSINEFVTEDTIGTLKNYVLMVKEKK